MKLAELAYGAAGIGIPNLAEGIVIRSDVNALFDHDRAEAEREHDLVFIQICLSLGFRLELVFISKEHPLAKKESLTIEDLRPYPYLVFEQGERNSFYFSEEFLSVLDFPKNIQVRDRATLFNLAIGLNGFTVSSGVLDQKLNGENIIARPLEMNCKMRIGMVRRKNMLLSRYAEAYIEAIKTNK